MPIATIGISSRSTACQRPKLIVASSAVRVRGPDHAAAGSALPQRSERGADQCWTVVEEQAVPSGVDAAERELSRYGSARGTNRVKFPHSAMEAIP